MAAEATLMVQGGPNSGKEISLSARPLTLGRRAERLMIAMFTWDTFPDADEFFRAYQVFMGVKTRPLREEGVTVVSKGTDTGRMWVAPEETVVLDQFGPVTLLIVADDEQTAIRAGELRFEALAQLAQ